MQTNTEQWLFKRLSFIIHLPTFSLSPNLNSIDIICNMLSVTKDNELIPQFVKNKDLISSNESTMEVYGEMYSRWINWINGFSTGLTSYMLLA